MSLLKNCFTMLEDVSAATAFGMLFWLALILLRSEETQKINNNECTICISKDRYEMFFFYRKLIHKYVNLKLARLMHWRTYEYTTIKRTHLGEIHEVTFCFRLSNLIPEFLNVRFFFLFKSEAGNYGQDPRPVQQEWLQASPWLPSVILILLFIA